MSSVARLRRLRAPALLGLGLGLSASCGGETPAPIPTTVKMRFADASDFYASPFPSDARLGADGTVDLHAFPLPTTPNLATSVLAMLDHKARGFGTTSGVFFELSAPIAADDLPSVHASVATGSPIALLSVDPASPDYLRRYPVSSRFLADAGPYGGKNLLAVVPLQGIPLRPKTLYAAIVTTGLRDTQKLPLGVSSEMTAVAKGQRPEGMSDAAFASYEKAISALGAASIDAKSVSGLAVFTTGAPTEELDAVVKDMLARPLPKPTAPFVRNEVFDDFCVYQTTIDMPEYQSGDPPYTYTGGDWTFDANGKPIFVRDEAAHFVVTIPRAPMPQAGYPIVVLSRTGAGGDRPLVDRGVQGMTGGPALVPGTGPGLVFAKAGFAGASIDGPHGGLRNVTMGDEQFLMFNVGNPQALRDNVRQSAAELVLAAHILEGVQIDVTDCPGATAPQSIAHFDPGTMALMGHSMGATISPLALAFEPRFRVGLLSGAGGSWIENVIYKLHPVAVKPLAEILVGVAGTGYELSEFDPILSMFQWAVEPADPPVYASRIVHEPVDGPPRNILMMQGIVDHYILPPIANATSLSFGLDLAGTELDTTAPEIADMPSLGGLLDLSGRKAVALPVGGNVTTATGGAVTAVVTQHPEDGVEDGHEVVFQTEAPKHEYRCFLVGLLSGAPRVPSPGKLDDPCD